MRLLGALLFGILMLQACGQTSDPVHTTELAESSASPATDDVFILSGGQLLYGTVTLRQEDIDDYWTPERSVVRRIEELLPAYVRDNPPPYQPEFWTEIDGLLKYVAGYETGGKRYIEFGSFEVEVMDYGSEVFRLVLDGGPGYFSGIYDVEADRIVLIVHNSRG